MFEMDLILVPKYLARSIIVGPRSPSSIPEEVRNAENMSNVSVTLIHIVRDSMATGPLGRVFPNDRNRFGVKSSCVSMSTKGI